MVTQKETAADCRVCHSDGSAGESAYAGVAFWDLFESENLAVFWPKIGTLER